MDLLDLFSLPFMRRALLAGLGIAVMAGPLGVFVVQQRLAFLGDGLAHAAFGGMGLGALLIFGFGLSAGTIIFHEPLWVALPFTLLTALGIAWVSGATRLSGDTAIGVFFAVSTALGVMCFSLIPPDTDVGVDVFDLLFGTILGVRRGDLLFVAGTCLLSLLFFVVAWGRLGYATFDSELARTDGLRVRALEYLLFAVAGVVVAVSALVVGIILIAAYLIIPAASAQMVSRSLIQMTLLSVAIGVATTLAGLVASFYLDVPSGSTVVLTQALVFVGAALVRGLTRRGGTPVI
ncbi:MAG: metal ABC transporter permease [Truepera sp.]|nr:metal ABC transporter permease [Truepera sp.]